MRLIDAADVDLPVPVRAGHDWRHERRFFDRRPSAD